MSWLEPDAEDRWSLRTARLKDGGWSDPVTVAQSVEKPFFVNWADFPSVRRVGEQRLVAHWLVRDGEGYAYSVRMAESRDEGRTWSEPWRPHEDASPTEHGFVSIVALGEGDAGLSWLDGRALAAAAAAHGEGAHGSGDASGDGSEGPKAFMQLRFRVWAGGGEALPEELVDGTVCDCCQPDMALAADGPVLAYRDRTADEVRDIYVARRVNGRWSEGVRVAEDGWVMPGCPVNGPAVDARGQHVVVAWFTAPEGERRVQVAFSSDGGASFGRALRVDGGVPLGRADVVLREDGSALVGWMEREGESAVWRVRAVRPDGAMGEPVRAFTLDAGRGSGFPRMVPHGDAIVLAWTEPGRPGGIHMRRVAVEE
ncbi:MAG: exo-alpha-sialidase [Gemmatimonadetes bacterium]|nr:MAG: exo-alpha-sialidase [Gemmatimonadota bacterium]